MDDAELRHVIYRSFAATGSPPSGTELEAMIGGPTEVSAALRRLHDAHAIVLDDRGEIRMALPFSAVDTPYRVVAGDRRWVANCAWDALAIPVALGIDARIDAPWFDDGAPVELAVVDDELGPLEGFVHFTVPARHWWDDIVET